MTNAKRIKIGTGHTTPLHDKTPQTIKVDSRPIRKAENEEYLKNVNVKAFLSMIGIAEGGDYHALFGWHHTSKWTFTNESTHPGAGKDGKTTAAGLYQINRACWLEMGQKAQGLTDFSPHTQDLIAVQNIRAYKALKPIIDGDIKTAINLLKANQWVSFQVHPYSDLESWYKAAGGVVK
ncbi:paar repeat-containing protein [Herbaspirillum sp. RTI4]|uniref:paar repeat-containing protein n=1 Tax=Herbaspirillum sp. RTI4 TaxID=3048640 RepID=UPI002AB42B49|nr:paar repeat-containing protein [Herbaspirillum sp. RTI4]MDY7576738.1 paar repeat-containing protein [Herbaspirillum sp. RTI4]MEA9983403.1 paar repeat-containing protein [Herbaspirillum sp. RTI4]